MSANSGPMYDAPEVPDNVRFEVMVAGTSGLSDEEKDAITDFFCDKITQFTEIWKQTALDTLAKQREEKLGGEFTPEERRVLTDGILRMMDQDPNEFRSRDGETQA